MYLLVNIIYFLGGLIVTVSSFQTATGRFISTPQIHLQKVTCIAFDSTSNFVITGSADSNVYVWSLASLLDIRSSERKQERILDRHQREITAIVPGRIGTGGPMDIVVTASRDLSCIVRFSLKISSKNSVILITDPLFIRYGTTTPGFIYERLYFHPCLQR